MNVNCWSRCLQSLDDVNERRLDKKKRKEKTQRSAQRAADGRASAASAFISVAPPSCHPTPLVAIKSPSICTSQGAYLPQPPPPPAIIPSSFYFNHRLLSHTFVMCSHNSLIIHPFIQFRPCIIRPHRKRAIIHYSLVSSMKIAPRVTGESRRLFQLNQAQCVEMALSSMFVTIHSM